MQNFENVFYTLRDEHDMLKDELQRIKVAVEQLQRDKAELVNALNEERTSKRNLRKALDDKEDECDTLRKDFARDVRNRDIIIDGLKASLSQHADSLVEVKQNMNEAETLITELKDKNDRLSEANRRVVANEDKLLAHNMDIIRQLNEEKVGRKRDAEDFRRRVLEQQHYFRDKINAVLQNREQVAESLRKAEGERHRYRVMYESTKHKTPISLGVENGRLKKKISQLQAQKRKWKRLHKGVGAQVQAKADLAEYWRHQLVQRNAELATCRATLFEENKRMEELRRNSTEVRQPDVKTLEAFYNDLSERFRKVESRVELLEERSKPSTDGGCW